MRYLLRTLTPAGVTERAIEIGPKDSDDPLAFVYGIARGIEGLPLRDKREKLSDLAPEFRRGWALGQRERAKK